MCMFGGGYAPPPPPAAPPMPEAPTISAGTSKEDRRKLRVRTEQTGAKSPYSIDLQTGGAESTGLNVPQG